jgi:feruloyl esterase
MNRLIALVIVLATGGAFAQAPPPATAEAKACAALLRHDFTALPDGPAALTGAEVVPPERDLPAYCRVQGIVAPRIAFEVRLPTANWNGKFLMQGCGGMCGIINMAAAEDALIRNYAVVNTDMGHTGNAAIAAWAHNDRQAELDFAYRATHVVAVAAKAIVAAHYGKPPARSYFNGCSTGGRQALVEAQRFPQDFDGIIAGAPVFDETGDGMLHLLWSARANLDANNKPILDAKKLPMIRKAVMAACDRLDGAGDDVLQDPRACTWTPADLACKGRTRDDCLSDAEIGALTRIYQGAHDSKGRRLFTGGMALGSEYEWAPGFVGTDGRAGAIVAPLLQSTAGSTGMITQFAQYLAFFNDPGAGYNPLSFDWDKDPQRLALTEVWYNAQNPDLRRFQAAGGKLIMYHGWDDMEIPPAQSVDYYELTTRTMGGLDATRDFFRLFMVPGMAHCRRGPGADAFDVITALEDWVERGTAPDTMLAYKLVKPQSYLGLPRIRFPLAREAYTATRILPAFPGVARWSGQGDVNDAAAWSVEN